MCAITLCSVCPTSSGSVRKATSTSTSRSTTSSTSLTLDPRRAPPAAGRAVRGPQRPGRGRRAAGSCAGSASRPSLGLARLLGARPGLGRPGGQHEVLAQRVALEPVGQQQRHEVRVAGEVDAEHLVGLPLVPGGAGEDARRRWPARRRRAAPGCAAAGARGGPADQSARRRRSRARRPASVHRGQPVEEGEAELVAGGGQGVDPGRRRHVDGRPGRTPTRPRPRRAAVSRSGDLLGAAVSVVADRDRRRSGRAAPAGR